VVKRPAAPTGWEKLDWIEHDSYLGLADADVDRGRCLEAFDRIPITGRVIDATSIAPPFIACFTEADDLVPVEVRRVADRVVTSVRLCWTNDVDDLEADDRGEWEEIGRLPIRSGACLAWDPIHQRTEGGLVAEVRPGGYRASCFFYDGDCLGLRIDHQPG
jgi:hypothetical protein